jgi:5-deoxy-D-glucuronate isomerase
MQYTADNLLIQPTSDDPNVIASVTRQQAGWKYISFQVQRFCLAARHAAIAPADALAHQLVAMQPAAHGLTLTTLTP